MSSEKNSITEQIKQEYASITNGAAGSNQVDGKIKIPKPVDQSGQSGIGEQESGTGIATKSVNVSRDSKQQ